MGIPEIRYNNAHFTPTEVIRGHYQQKSVVGRLEIYQPLGDGDEKGLGETYLHVILEQPSDRRKSPFAVDAHLVRGMNASGGWRQSNFVAPHTVRLIADGGAPLQPKPAMPTLKVSKTAREYLAATYGDPSKVGQ